MGGFACTTQAHESIQMGIPQCEENNLLSKGDLALGDLDPLKKGLN